MVNKLKFLKLYKSRSIISKSHSEGFTLLEVVIALAIMALSFSAILAVEGGSIKATDKAKEMNVVGMLAKNKMVETEYELQGKKLAEAKKEDAGVFPSPYEDYRWKTTVKEIEFPSLGMGGGSGSGSSSSSASSSSSSSGPTTSLGQSQMESMVGRMITTYLNKTIREVTVTIIWRTAGKDQNFSLATYWVDLNHEFNPSEF